MPVGDVTSPSLSILTSLPPGGLPYENQQSWLALSSQYAFLIMTDYNLWL